MPLQKGHKINAGRKRTKEECLAISKGRKGMKFSKEHRKNLSISHKGKGLGYKKGSIPWIKGKKRSEETKLKISLSKKGKPNFNNRGDKCNFWRGDRVGYAGIHIWLKNKFGKPTGCEGEDCRKNSIIYEWCLMKNRNYERKRDNFIKLCRSCHRRYDFNESRMIIAKKNFGIL